MPPRQQQRAAPPGGGGGGGNGGSDSDIEIVAVRPAPGGGSGPPQPPRQRQRQQQQQQQAGRRRPPEAVIDLAASSDDEAEVRVTAMQPGAKRPRRTPPKPARAQQPAAKAITCPVCLEEIQEGQMAATPCGHVFCYACIAACCKAKKTCPNCRKPVQMRAVHKIYLPS